MRKGRSAIGVFEGKNMLKHKITSNVVKHQT